MPVSYAANLLSSYPLSPRFSRWMNRPACHPCFPHLPVYGVGWPTHKFTWTVPHGMFCDLGVSDVHRQGTAVPQSFSHRKCATNFPWISGFWHLGQNEVSLENFCCTFCRETGLHGNFGVRMNLGRHRTALQDFPSKLYFCGHKTPFRLHKSDLPNATASERFHRCFALRKKVW